MLDDDDAVDERPLSPGVVLVKRSSVVVDVAVAVKVLVTQPS